MMMMMEEEDRTETVDDGPVDGLRVLSLQEQEAGGAGTTESGATTSDAPPSASVSSPVDEKAEAAQTIKVTVLLLSGQRKTFPFERQATVLQVKQHVLDHWPMEWGGGAADRYPSGLEGIRLIFRGKILENPVRLEDAGFKVNTTTIVHMAIQTIQDAAELEAETSKKQGKRASGRHVMMPGPRPSDLSAEAGQNSTGCCRCIIA